MSVGKRKKAEKLFQEQKAKGLEAPRGPHDFMLVLDHLEPDFNPGKIYRSADAFGCREIHVVGMPFFDPGPSKGSFKHVPSRYHDDIGSALRALREEGYRLYALVPGGLPSLIEEPLPGRSAFILGNEADGISFRLEDHPDVRPLRIPQFGNPQSLNVSVAASIAMYEWARRHAEDLGPQHKPDRR